MALWIFLGIGGFVNGPNVDSDKIFIEKEIKPSVDFVKNFRKDNNRLPTNKEFYTWERIYYKNNPNKVHYYIDTSIIYIEKHQYIRNDSSINKENLNKFKKANWNKDFAICVWRGDWEIYYFSWTDSYDSERYSASKDIIGFIIIILIGLLPLLFWFIYYKRKRKAVKENISTPS